MRSTEAVLAVAVKPKVLNNLVTELVNLESVPAKPAYQEIPFTNPREGWVFVSATTRLDSSDRAVEDDDAVKISIDADKEDAVLNYPFGGAITRETMRFLTAGEHTLRIWFSEKPELATFGIRNLIVRAVPAMIHCGHASAAMGGYGVYDSTFLERDVLPNINTIIGDADIAYQDIHKAWKDRGGQWYLEQNLPSFFKGSRNDRLVFRALGTTAKLTISDWIDATDPGGPIGQEILYNFVEVQPYIED